MKKIITIRGWLVCLLILITATNRAQSVVPTTTPSFSRDQFNFILFGGNAEQRMNTGFNNQNVGAYADVMVIKNLHWLLGPYLMYDYSWSENNLAWYHGHSYELGAGVTAGYFSSAFSGTHKIYSSLSIGVKSSRSTGSTSNILGRYDGTQKDFILTSNFDLDLIKKRVDDILPRSQFIIAWQAPLNTSLDAKWNDQPISNEAWNTADLSIWSKQSLKNWSVGNLNYLAVKVLTLYEHAQTNQNLLGLGGEVSLFKLTRDDYFLINCLYRWHPIYGLVNDFYVQIVINFTSLL
jgi:hypothetical protein